MNGDQSFARPALRLRTGSRTMMGELGKVRRAASNILHASSGALAPERQAPSFESGSALNSTRTSLRRPLSMRWRIRVAERTVREKRSSMRVWSLPGEITSANEDKLVSCVVSCSKCSERRRRGQTWSGMRTRTPRGLLKVPVLQSVVRSWRLRCFSFGPLHANRYSTAQLSTDVHIFENGHPHSFASYMLTNIRETHFQS